MPNRILVALIAVGALAGCAQTTQSDRADLLDQPIDCMTADIDIAARIARRVRGQLDERREIASGRTKDDLRARIAEIEAASPNANSSNVVAAG